MKSRIILLLLLTSFFLLWSAWMAQAECLFGCIFQAGTACIDDECVPLVGPVVTPGPVNEIRLSSTTADKLVPVMIDCASLDIKTVKIFLSRQAPPPSASFYSLIYYGDTIFYAQKDILNQYRFLRLDGVLKPQFVGIDFVFNVWENIAFAEVLRSLSCAEIKKMGLNFNFGISIKGDWTDVESATFTFK